ncbi:hypothetical protein [Escherichia coli]
MHPADFQPVSLRRQRKDRRRRGRKDVLMQKAAGLAGGVRFGEEGRRL